MAQILDLAERAAKQWDVSFSHFVSPPVAADALAAINQRADIKAVAWGGYPQAERCRVAIGKEEVMLTAVEDPSSLEGAVVALDCRGNFMFDPATHRDFLGAILGTGVVRDRIGVSVRCCCGLVMGTAMWCCIRRRTALPTRDPDPCRPFQALPRVCPPPTAAHRTF